MNIGRFFLDVMGTITGQPDYDYNYEVKRSKSLIQELIGKDSLDELRVSIVSSDGIEEVKEYGKLLEQRLSGIDNLHFGHHHANCKMMHVGGVIRDDKNNKCDQMLENLKVCEHSVCYYADDCYVNRMITEDVLARLFPNMKVVVFDPKEKSLLGLNNAVEEYLEKK